jgi:hypothetical protein
MINMTNLDQGKEMGNSRRGGGVWGSTENVPNGTKGQLVSAL